jgi:hypothetical protein
MGDRRIGVLFFLREREKETHTRRLQSVSEAHPVSFEEPFPRSKSGKGDKLTTHLLLVPRLRKHEVLPLFTISFQGVAPNYSKRKLIYTIRLLLTRK